MAVVAETRSGPIRGREKDDVLLFAGIPYATTRRKTIVFDDTSGVAKDPDGEERAAWEGLR